MVGKKIKIKGIVQGVGFRPFIYKNAVKNNLRGFVNNTSKGVFIEVEGEEKKIELFIQKIKTNPPVLSKITEIEVINKEINGFKEFKIVESQEDEEAVALISPDIATCNDCLKDISDKDNRRYRYAFTNCTNCGPRFSITKRVPYDRQNTTMEEFKLCKNCKDEYTDPLNRRFHAQPNACSECGPRVFICDQDGKEIKSDDPIKATAEYLKQGKIVAIKGIGGFHLACDGKDKQVINSLRSKKNRPHKPLALMMNNLETVKKYCVVSEAEEKILLGNKKPILLLDKKEGCKLPTELAGSSKKLGVMLPYTPVHYILFSEGIDVLVMTSANLSGEPMVYKNEEAISKLKGIADYYLMNNREIYIPIDDSVSRVIYGKERILRNARGYAPTAISVKVGGGIIACGSNTNNTFCISNNENIFMSNYIGDLLNYNTCKHYRESLDHLKNIYRISPKKYIYDLHPNYYENEYLAEVQGEKIGVQHHHAHIVSCMLDNDVSDRVIGVAFDGTGYGDDGKLWGGEFLVCDRLNYKRIGHLNYVKLPSGEGAIKEPWKMAISYLFDAFGEQYEEYLTEELKEKNHRIIVEMIKKNINSLDTSSIGRLFDGVSALLGFNDKITYQGEAAIELENICDINEEDNYPYRIYSEGETYLIDSKMIIRSVVMDLKQGINNKLISRRFHNTIIKFTCKLCKILRDKYRINMVVLSGGVFQNEILLKGVYEELKQNNFQVYIHERIPANDEGISVGQMIIGNLRK